MEHSNHSEHQQDGMGHDMHEGHRIQKLFAGDEDMQPALHGLCSVSSW